MAGGAGVGAGWGLMSTVRSARAEVEGLTGLEDGLPRSQAWPSAPHQVSPSKRLLKTRQPAPSSTRVRRGAAQDGHCAVFYNLMQTGQAMALVVLSAPLARLVQYLLL